MGIYIPDVEMPENCARCPISRITALGNAYCPLANGIQPADQPRPGYCLFVPIPPHGRLIDADALFEKVYKAWGTEYDAGESNWFMDMINEAPTIILAEEAAAP